MATRDYTATYGDYTATYGDYTAIFIDYTPSRRLGVATQKPCNHASDDNSLIVGVAAVGWKGCTLTEGCEATKC
jgi:hypothetical protein